MKREPRDGPPPSAQSAQQPARSQQTPPRADQPAPAPGSEGSVGFGFRPDIQGLRAVAVLLVLLYHVELGPSSGFLGVDVFFVLSGFLITGLLLREHRRTRTIRLGAFWARRARRLLPASALVLVTTCVIARYQLPAARWESTGLDAVTAAGYVINWHLAGRSVDYLAQDDALSPLQHYWSLAIEEQFYLLWPLLLALLLRARSRGPALLGTALITGGSLLLALTSSGPQPYFTTHTRIWELAAGAGSALLVGIVPGRVTSPQWLRALAGWGGAALVLAAVVLVRPSTHWPGPLTVPVVLGTCLLLCFGTAAGGPGRWLSVRPLVRLGDISYSLYLWHWPLVTLAMVDGRLRIRERVAVVVVSVLLAALTYRLVERPARSWRRWARPGPALIGGLALALVAAGSGAGLARARSVEDAINPPGAAAVIEVQPVATALAPRPEQAKQDNGVIYERGCPADYGQSRVRTCIFDYRTGPVSATVVAVGDSKQGQWIPALQVLAREQHWRLMSITKAGCPFSDITRRRGGGNSVYASCVTWNRRVLQKVQRISPDLVVTTALQSYTAVVDGQVLHGQANHEELVRGLGARLSQLREQGFAALAIAETPWMGTDMADCVSLHLDSLADCARPRDQALADRVVAEAARRSSTPWVDLDDRLCTQAVCPAVIGDVLIYRDRHHLTATYSATLAPFLAERMGRALTPDLPDLAERLGLPVDPR